MWYEKVEVLKHIIDSNFFILDCYWYLTFDHVTNSEMYQLKVKQGKTYLLRIINAALNEQHFFKIANHTFTVVAIDALYTQHYKTDVVVLAPGQTVDVLFSINQPVGSYYMAFTPYHSAPRIRRQLLGVPNIFAEAPNSFHKVWKYPYGYFWWL